MTQQTKRKISTIKEEVVRAINGLNKELEDLRHEAEADYVETGVVPPLSQIDEELTARIVNAFSLNNKINTWCEKTNTEILNNSPKLENEMDYLTAISTQSDDFLNLINNI